MKPVREAEKGRGPVYYKTHLRQVLEERWEVILRGVELQQSLSLATQRPFPRSGTLRGAGREGRSKGKNKKWATLMFVVFLKKECACPLPFAWRCKPQQTAAESRSSWCKHYDRHSASRLSVSHKTQIQSHKYTQLDPSSVRERWGLY